MSLTPILVMLAFAVIGALVGLLTALALNVQLFAFFAVQPQGASTKATRPSAASLTGTVLGIPATWFAAPWISSRFFAGLDLSQVLPFYVAGLGLIVLALIGPPIITIVNGVHRGLRAVFTGDAGFAADPTEGDIG